MQPYAGAESESDFNTVREGLRRRFPLSQQEIVSAVQTSFDFVYETRFGGTLRLGKDIFLSASAIGGLMEQALAHGLNQMWPGRWRQTEAKHEKDFVFLADNSLSFELKTSTTPRGFWENASYTKGAATSAKDRSGYYLAINYDNPTKRTRTHCVPRIRTIRMGWFNREDWKAQSSGTGQQAWIPARIVKRKMWTLYP